ncbi:MAG: RNA polymerase sigma factor [Pirellulaceae bacterium]
MTDEDRLYERLLVLRSQTEDEGALTELIGLYSPRLRYYLRKMLPRRDSEAEDLLQEIWCDAVRSLGSLRDATAFPAWIYRIARDRAWRLLRKHQPAASLSEADLPTAAEEPEFTAEDAAAVHVALAELPAEQREVLVLRFLEGMTYEEIATITAAPLGTVRSRLFYGKVSLRQLLAKDYCHD